VRIGAPKMFLSGRGGEWAVPKALHKFCLILKTVLMKTSKSPS